MVGIKRVDHVCMAVRSIEEQLPFFTELLGMRLVDRFRNNEEGYAGVALEIPGSQLLFELLEPTTEDGFLARFLRERGPGLHHITLEVQDIERAAARLREWGIEPFGGIRRSAGWAETFIHPRDSGGVLFQLYQAGEGSQ